MIGNLARSGTVVFSLAVTGLGEAQEHGYLSSEEAKDSIRLQDGYSLELVLSDPDIQEPVALAWDGNGALYVVEMRTYMQDADATGEKKPISRISRHEDVDGDGIYEKHSVFIDNLKLPRMILPLDDRLMVGVTDTLDLWTYRDGDGDGVADEKVKVYEGGPRGGNMEHQPSGLLWNIDNWLYCTYEAKRYRFTDGKLVAEDLPKGEGQWGLGRDDVGRLYYSVAGGEKPALTFQQPIVYGALNLPVKEQEAGDFRTVYPIVDAPDVQGGPRRLNQQGSLNHFTGGGGQSIYRGDRLPENLQGDLILPEPVGRLIRRAEVTRENGATVLSNYYSEEEFVASTDVNFRPLWTATSPDGAMMMIDMHRGIIQQASWTRKGSYLRGVIDEWGLAKNIGKGRIYRLEHTGYRPDRKPQMLEETTGELVTYLSHPNGWWRDTAQKLIILREDRESVIPEVEELVRSGSSALGRLHGLWTLEGMGGLTPGLLVDALVDEDSRVRTAAIRVGEPFFAKGESSLAGALLTNDYLSDDIEMQLQFLNSVQFSQTKREDLLALAVSLKAAQKDHAVVHEMEEMHEILVRNQREAEARRLKDQAFAEAMSRGQTAYEQLCFACHGADGKGTPMPGVAGQFLAPSFANNPRLAASDESSILTLLHGLTGELDGRDYEGVMAGMGTNSDQWIAEVTTYIRNSFGNEAAITSPELVAFLREKYQDRDKPWTEEELEQIAPKPLSREGWKLKASHGAKGLKYLVDGDRKSRYTTDKRQMKGMWIEVELPEEVLVSGFKMDHANSKGDFPRGYQLEVSSDGKNWSQPIASGAGGKRALSVKFVPVKAKFLKFELTSDVKKNLFWSIHELEFYGSQF